jgi:hypothetical protein
VWRPSDRKTVYVCAVVLSVAIFFAIACLWATWRSYLRQTPAHPAPFGDFLALWSYAEVLARFPAGDLYHSDVLYQRQVAWGMDPSWWNPFPYPPLFMPIVRALNVLPYDLSYLAWVGGTLLLLLWVVYRTCSRSACGLITVALAPASVLTFVGGQSGFLAAALMTAGLRLAGTRPVLAGVALGVLAYKPQLGVLLPVVLAATGAWTVLLWAAVTVLGLGVLTGLVYGWALWPAWIAMLPGYNATFRTQTNLWNQQPTLIALWHRLHWPDGAGTVVQIAVFLSVAAIVWHCARRMSPGDAAALVIVGTFVATPHALVYDMPVVAVGAVLFVRDRLGKCGSLATMEVAGIAAVLLLPAYMMAKAIYLPIGWPCVAVLFAVIARSAFGDAAVTLSAQPDRGAAAPAAPVPPRENPSPPVR